MAEGGNKKEILTKNDASWRKWIARQWLIFTYGVKLGVASVTTWWHWHSTGHDIIIPAGSFFSTCRVTKSTNNLLTYRYIKSCPNVVSSIYLKKRPLWWPRPRWEDNIIMDLKKNKCQHLFRQRILILENPRWMRYWTSRFHKPWS